MPTTSAEVGAASPSRAEAGAVSPAPTGSPAEVGAGSLTSAGSPARAADPRPSTDKSGNVGLKDGSGSEAKGGKRRAAAETAPAKPAEIFPAERPPGAPPDPWTAFATEGDRPPGRIRRASRVVKRAAVHEYALVTYIALALSAAMTWPTLRYPMHTVPQDVFDPVRQAWQLSWLGHILTSDPIRVWQSNAFHPEAYSYVWGSSLLGYAPAGMIGDGPGAALLRYNILFVLAHALLIIGGYALVRQLGANRTGAALAAAAITFAPWRLAQEGHLDIISAGGIPLALAMLARGHGWSIRRGLRPRRRSAGWAAAGWAVAAWQISLGFAMGLPFAYVLGGLLLVMAVAVPIRRWREPSRLPVLGWRLLVTDLLGALIVAGLSALIAVPYFRWSGGGSATAEIDFFSAPVHGLLIGPAESRIWGAPHEPTRAALGWPSEMALLPGFVLYALALAGLVFSIWKWWQRLLLLSGAVVAGILTVGTSFFDGRWTYLPLFGHFPASMGVTIPGRLMFWVTLLLAILAAGAVTELVRRAEQLVALRVVRPWPGPWLRLAMLVPLLLVLGEGWNATAHPVVPAQPAAMRASSGPMLLLPTSSLTDQTALIWTTSRFQPVANGGGGFAAARQAEMRTAVASFPDAASIDYLRRIGVGTVLLIRSQAAGTSWERAGDTPVDMLGITREDLDEDTVLFRLGA